MQKHDYSTDETLPDDVLTLKRTTTAWINYVLRNRGIKINDIRTDLSDGLVLLNILEVLMEKEKISAYPKPRMRAQFLQNCAQAISTVKDTAQLKLRTFISPEDFMVGSLKPMLDFFWDLIEHYHIKKIPFTASHPRGALLPWVQERLDAEYDLSPKNLSSDWKDGSVIYALVDSLNKGSLDYKSRSRDPYADTVKAVEYASKTYGIPMIIDPREIISAPDDLSLILYLSYFQQYVAGIKPPVDTFVETKWHAEQKPRPEVAKPAPKPKPRRESVVEEKAVLMADPTKCEVNFPIVLLSSTEASFTIFVKDPEGNPTNQFENLDIVVTFANGSKIPYQIQSPEKGTIVVKLPIIERVGRLLAHVKLNNTELPKNPFVSYCSPEIELECTMIGSGLKQAYEQTSASFYIQTLLNGTLYKVTPDAFSIQITGRKTITPTIVSVSPGIVQVTYKPFKKGQYVIQCSLFGKPIPNAGGNLSVLSDKNIPDPLPSNFSPQNYEIVGLNSKYIQNTPFSFKIVPKVPVDLCGNSFWVFAFGGKSGIDEYPVDVVTEENGSVAVTIFPIFPGVMDIDLSVGDVPLLASLDVEIVVS